MAPRALLRRGGPGGGTHPEAARLVLLLGEHALAGGSAAGRDRRRMYRDVAAGDAWQKRASLSTRSCRTRPVQLDPHARQLDALERAVERRGQRLAHVPLLGRAEEADRVRGRAVDPEQRHTRADAVRRAEQRAVAADGDDEVAAAVDPEVVRPVVPAHLAPEVGERGAHLLDGLGVIQVPGPHAPHGLVARVEEARDAGVAALLRPICATKSA